MNGIDISEEILTSNGPLTIIGDKTFTKDIEVQGDLNVTGLVAGYDIRKLNERIMFVDQSKELTGTNTFEKDLEIRGMSNFLLMDPPGFVMVVYIFPISNS